MSRQGRVLVMDDQVRWRNELRDTMRRGGFHVDVAATTEEALECLKQSYYHLLVLDIRMEGTDQSNVEGMNFLHKLNELNLSTAVKTVMLSAYGTKEQMRRAFTRFETADFLSKEEFDNEEFLKLIQDIFIAAIPGRDINH